jgi:hypothetical protein
VVGRQAREQRVVRRRRAALVRVQLRGARLRLRRARRLCAPLAGRAFQPPLQLARALCHCIVRRGARPQRLREIRAGITLLAEIRTWNKNWK